MTSSTTTETWGSKSHAVWAVTVGRAGPTNRRQMTTRKSQRANIHGDGPNNAPHIRAAPYIYWTRAGMVIRHITSLTKGTDSVRMILRVVVRRNFIQSLPPWPAIRPTSGSRRQSGQHCHRATRGGYSRG